MVEEVEIAHGVYECVNKIGPPEEPLGRIPVYNPGFNIELHEEQWEAVAHALLVCDEELGRYIMDEIATSGAEERLTVYGLVHDELNTIAASLYRICRLIREQQEAQK